MKKLISSILVTVALFAVITPALAQETPKTRFISFTQEAKDAGNVAFTLSPCYAPSLKDKNGKDSHWGAGAALTYTLTGDVGKFTFAGIRLDYLGGELWAPSVNGGLKADVQILGHTFTPVAYSGAVFPLASLQDATGSVGIITGGGVKTEVWQGQLFKHDATLFAGYAAERWNMQDGHQFDGLIHRGFVGLKIKF